MITKIKYRIWWRLRLRFGLFIRKQQRRWLWHRHAQEAEYKPYGANKGSGWSGCYKWQNRVIAYQDKSGTIWCGGTTRKPKK
jgi:hypothetical protein